MSKQAKENYFSKKTKSDMDKRDADQKAISKVLAKYQKKWGEPVAEIFIAQEEGIKIGKQHRAFEVEDLAEKKASEMSKETYKKIEELAQARVKDLLKDQFDNMDAEKMAHTLVHKLDREGATVMVLSCNFKEKVGKGIIAAAGTIGNYAKLLKVTARASEELNLGILHGAKRILEDELFGGDNHVCHCSSCRAERDRA